MPWKKNDVLFFWGISGKRLDLDFSFLYYYLTAKSMGEQTMAIKIGDSVVVKSGVDDPDFGGDIGGWQGRVRDMDDEVVSIEWDSITLREMGLDLIIRCENENFDWEVMRLNHTDVRKASSRDSERDVTSTAGALRARMMDDPRLENKE